MCRSLKKLLGSAARAKIGDAPLNRLVVSIEIWEM
mgnify:CR=1 FL=1